MPIRNPLQQENWLPDHTGVSVVNSTSTPLASGGVYTGQWEPVLNYRMVSVTVATDQDGTLEIQFSSDKINVDHSMSTDILASYTNAPVRAIVTASYVRIIFTNGVVSDQTYLRLNTIAGDKPTQSTLSDSIVPHNHEAISVRPSNFSYELALGAREGYSSWSKWGYNDDIDTGTETIWSNGGVFLPLTTARTLSIVSTSSNDTHTTGTGARSVIVTGIDENRMLQVVTYQLTGLTPVVTPELWFGINLMQVISAGGSWVNEGVITATATVDLTVQAHIPIGVGITQQAFFFTQANHTTLIDWLFINYLESAGGATPIVEFKVWVYFMDLGVKSQVFTDQFDASIENHVELTPSHPFILPQNSFFTIECTTTKDNTVVSARFSLIEAHTPGVNV